MTKGRFFEPIKGPCPRAAKTSRYLRVRRCTASISRVWRWSTTWLSVVSILVACDEHDGALRVELPGIQEIRLFEQLLAALSRAALDIEAPALILAGYAPPVDETVAW